MASSGQSSIDAMVEAQVEQDFAAYLQQLALTPATETAWRQLKSEWLARHYDEILRSVVRSNVPEANVPILVLDSDDELAMPDDDTELAVNENGSGTEVDVTDDSMSGETCSTEEPDILDVPIELESTPAPDYGPEDDIEQFASQAEEASIVADTDDLEEVVSPTLLFFPVWQHGNEDEEEEDEAISPTLPFFPRWD